MAKNGLEQTKYYRRVLEGIINGMISVFNKCYGAVKTVYYIEKYGLNGVEKERREHEDDTI
jgi:hypothetical protein